MVQNGENPNGWSSVSIKQNSDPLEILESHTLRNAVQSAPVCLPQTRLAILDKINAWAHQVDATTPILWLSGHSGVGKSTVLRTVVESWGKENIPNLSFFRPPGMNNNLVQKCLVPTLACQLVSAVPAVRVHVKQSILSDPTLFDSPIEAQFRSLIIGPLAATWDADSMKKPIYVILDGLDEGIANAASQDDHETIMRGLLSSVHRQSGIRCVFSSRDPPGRSSSLISHLTMTGALAPITDIGLFLRYSTDGQGITSIARAAEGSFIYATTALLFLTNPHTDFEHNLKSLKDSQRVTAMSALDTLYTEILNNCPPKSLPIIFPVLESLCFTWLYSDDMHSRIFSSITGGSVRFYEKLLHIPEGHLRAHLNPLHTVVDIPSTRTIHPADSPIALRHASFHEHLLDQSRGGRFSLNRPQALVNLQSTLMKHTFIILSPSCPDKEYDERALLRLLLRGYADPECPASKELKAGIDVLLDPDDQRYYEHLVGIGLGYLGRGRRIGFLDLIKPQEELDIYRYLQKCNIPEIEPHMWRRWLSSLYIAPQIALLRNAFR